MAQTTEGASETVEAVRFSFMSVEEVRKHSVVKITNPILLDSVERPVPGGLYDPSLGPLDDQTPCKSCGQRAFHCPGHCGHIDFVSPVYNPLMFDMLHNLLQQTCFSCFHFRADRSQVNICTSQLEMIAKGDIIEAKRLDEARPQNSPDHSEDSDGSHVTSSTVHSGPQCKSSDYQKQHAWSSLQFTEARSVLNKFLKLKSVKCKDCGAKNPTITKPTFGWFHMSGMSAADTRENIIRGCQLKELYNGGGDSNLTEGVHELAFEKDLSTAEPNLFTATSDDIEDHASKRNLKKGGRSPLDTSKNKGFFSGPLLPSEVRNILKLLWENEIATLSYIWDIQHDKLNISDQRAGHSMFFMDALLVPPIKFRPASRGSDSVMEHPHTVLLGKVVQANIAFGNAHVNNSERSKIVNRWLELQQSVNVLFDGKTAVGGQRDVSSGICQLLEKKEGIFRQKMMGKRVNFACRSVISPDPYLAVNEIGIPPYFALRLTYPERVTPWNVAKLRNAIINGSEIHPGATYYADKVSTVKLPPSKKMRLSISRKLPSSRGVAMQSGKNDNYEIEGKIVYRHLQDGDIVLVNRQPTLHKPSIMAHVVRVLKGEKTLRMHYANCSSYNADFDGDEMNVHLPQDEVSRAEAYNIVNANNQYIVPTRGDTVRGLIQDHIVGAVLLTMKNTFLTREKFNQLVYSSGVFAAEPGSSSDCLSRKLSVLDSNGLLHPVLPAVWKPIPLWTGKQVITALLNHLTRGFRPCTVENDGKIPYQYFARETGKNQPIEDDEDNAENKLLIWKNELVRGVIDKAQFGKYGLVHTVQELYGSNSAGILLSALSRLFTVFLQIYGFTCGVDDLIVLPHYDIERKEELEGEDVGEKVHCDFVNFKRGKIGPLELHLEIEKAILRNGQSATARLDGKMKNELSEKGSKINKELLLKGLLKTFPNNCISLMTISGAKGSTVNFQQISSSLGQQELEGKRVPRMTSGKTLPSFPPWDFSSRAGGYITDRFLTGLRPQEYYFHCMAGREGLVDTAVKTSRSGYLQRCLIKNLECLKVCYDYTVRDADGSIVQFCYGEDGVDVHQTSFLNKFEALAANREVIGQKLQHQLEFNPYIKDLPEKLKERVKELIEELPEVKVSLKKRKQKDLLMLMKQKYLSSLAPSGEPVGVIAAQSVGEPSTQMTLNTFHLAGRGEMNVTLGIPRLQEILMTASNEILTPIVTCCLLEGKSMDDAKVLVAKMKKVTVADLIESIEVCVLPLSIHNREISRIYKLRMKLKEHELVFPEDCEETLEVMFLRELEDAIENHLILLSKIRGIKNFKANSQSNNTNEKSEGASGSRPQEEEDGDDDNDNDERAEDLGSDVQKRKQQTSNEMDYEDGSEDELHEVEASNELAKETDQADDGNEAKEDGEEDEEDGENEDEASKMPNKGGTILKSEKEDKQKKVKAKLVKETDKAIFVEAKGLHLEVHLRFTNEPHILLAQIAQKAAKKVSFKSSGKVEHCQRVAYSVHEKQVLWDQEKLDKENAAAKRTRRSKKDLSKLCALKAAGVDLIAFWEMQDELDVNRVYSNNIHVMLNTYGVEVARKTIIMEVENVFKIYGVQIDHRHLSLIADYMTHAGGYRPMSRHGSIAESISPFIKMSFETASKFIVEAASHGMTDNLETPSARICLGLPVKVGTGSFDLMQKLDI